MSAAVTMGHSVMIWICTPCGVGIGTAAACGGVARQSICPACLLSGASDTAEYMHVLQLAAMSSPPCQQDADASADCDGADGAQPVDPLVALVVACAWIADAEVAFREGAGGGVVFHVLHRR